MIGQRWLVLAVLFFARTAMGFQFQSVASMSPLLVDALKIDFAMLGALVGAWMLPGTLLAIPGGLLGRRFGDKAVVLFGLALMAAGTFLTAQAETYGVAMAGRVVSGIGAVLLNVLLTKMVGDWFADRELSTAMAILVASWPLGIGLALVVLGPLASLQSWPFAMNLTAWTCVAALLLVALLAQRPGARPDTVQTRSLSWRIGRREFLCASVAGAIWTLYNAAYIIVVSFAPVLLVEKGLGTANAALVASFATWPVIVTIPLGGVLADRTGRGHEIMLATFVAVAAAMPLMLVGPPLVVLAAIGLLTGPAAGLIMALPTRALPPASRHLGMGIYFTYYYLGMALLPGAAGWFRDATALTSAPLLFASALLLAAAACALYFRSLTPAASAPRMT